VAAGVGRTDHGCVRICVLVAAVALGVLAAPAIARSDPGMTTAQQLLQQAGAAGAEAQKTASQAVAAASSAAAAAPMSAPASVPASVASAESQVTKTV
jgi:hypothetical protein